MSKIIFVTGGARSGKSMFAQKLAEKSEDVAYVATAQAFDSEMQDRIALHQSARSQTWTTYECPNNMAGVFFEKKHSMYLVDCLTVYISNAIVGSMDEESEIIDMEMQYTLENAIMKEMQSIMDTIRKMDENAIFVSNEVGMGLVPAYPMGRMFRDIAGRVNRLIASCADEAYLIVSGIPMKLK